MSIDESRFHLLADTLLQELVDALDAAIGDEVDVDLQGGVLTVDLGDGGQYVVNKHAAMRQIWLSSPVSGAWHFDPEDGRWLASKDRAVALTALLAAELSSKTGATVTL